jgi:transcriptional regulator with XRE-family HTH domain
MILQDPAKLKRLMDKRGVSRRDLAEAAGWMWRDEDGKRCGSHSVVSRLLTGKLRSVTELRGNRIAHALGVRVGDLFLVKASTQTVSGFHHDGNQAA